MYEKDNSKKRNQHKDFYTLKSGKGNGKGNKNIILIVGLVFMIGILITFFMRNNGTSDNLDEGNKVNSSDNSEVQDNKGDNDSDLNQVPEVDSDGVLTKEEVAMVKSAIEGDTMGYFQLVNKENLLEEGYKPDNLIIPNVGITKDRENEQNLVREDIADDVEGFLGAAKEAGHEIFLSSGYRSFNLQSIFYNNDLSSNGGIETGYVAAPGTSEHQLGIAIDLTSHNVNLELTDEFGNTPEGQWALENAHKYGFILRYNKDKENITGYEYEPWHFRYIGDKNISTICYEKDLTLEELIEYAK